MFSVTGASKTGLISVVSDMIISKDKEEGSDPLNSSFLCLHMLFLFNRKKKLLYNKINLLLMNRNNIRNE